MIASRRFCLLRLLLPPRASSIRVLSITLRFSRDLSMHLTKGAEKAAAAPIIDGAIYLTETILTASMSRTLHPFDGARTANHPPPLLRETIQMALVSSLFTLWFNSHHAAAAIPAWVIRNLSHPLNVFRRALPSRSTTPRRTLAAPPSHRPTLG